MHFSFLVPVISIIFIVFIGTTFLYFYLKNLQEDIGLIWEKINQKTRLRLDKLPLLVELIRRTSLVNHPSTATTIQEIVDDREKIWPLEEPSPQKVQWELALTSQLHELWKLMGGDPTLKNDVALIALRKEISDLGEEIDILTDTYNQKIYRFNQKLRTWWPFTLFFGFRRLTIFEFEA